MTTSLSLGMGLPDGWVVQTLDASRLRVERPSTLDRAVWKKRLGTTLGAALTALALLAYAVSAPETWLIEVPVAFGFLVIAGFGVHSVRLASRALASPLALEVSGANVLGMLADRTAVQASCADVKHVGVREVPGVSTSGLELHVELRDGRTLIGPRSAPAEDQVEASLVRLLATELSTRTGAPLR